MHFAEGHYFHLLWLVGLLILFLGWAKDFYLKKLSQFASSDLISELLIHFDPKVFRLKQILIVLVFVFSIISLARPQWGFEWREVKRQGLDILVAVDVSKSMLTQDVKPNRLKRAKLMVQDLVQQLKGDRIGLVAFAGDAFLMCPLTIDYNGFLLSLNDVGAESIPRGGTNLARAIEVSLKGFEQIPSKYKAIIFITDGESLEGDYKTWAKKAKEAGIKIYTVGIGTKEGELIQVMGDQGQLEFLKDQSGNVVKSRLNETSLQEVALLTGGIYVRSGAAESGLDIIYNRQLANLKRREFESKREKLYHEHFQIPLAIAFLLLMMETCLNPRRQKQYLFSR